jgi:hypothetical protein
VTARSEKRVDSVSSLARDVGGRAGTAGSKGSTVDAPDDVIAVGRDDVGA